MRRIELMPWEAARAQVGPIRFQVFVEEQGVPREIELDQHDAVSIHAVVFEEGKPVATGRLLPDGHIGRMAVLREWRNRGIGGALLLKLIDEARRLGHPQVLLSAQVHAVPFYRAHGFLAEGPEYEEAGITHQAMKRRLWNS